MTGRFINADAIEMLDQTKDRINGLNLYVYCGNNPVNRTDRTGTDWLSDMFGWIAVGALAIGAVALTVASFGVAAPLGAVMFGAGIGIGIGMGTSIVSQAIQGGGINPWQVAFNGVMGGATGALMASPLGWLGTGAAVGGLGFVQSVGNDLFDNGGDWGKVNWGAAIATGIISGIVAGGAKALLQNVTLMNKFVNKFPGVFKWGHKIGEAAYVNFWKALTIGQTVYKGIINGISGGLRALAGLI